MKSLKKYSPFALAASLLFLNASFAQLCHADRSWTTTYNAQNLLESEDGPRIDAQDITTHTYNTNGTRATTTNALGHVTSYTSYDAMGRNTAFTDPNGVITTIKYNHRGLVEDVIVKHPGNINTLNVVTHSEYDEAGKLKTLTQPNGMALHYEYSDAGTLKAVYNDTGERIDYILDAAGNRKSETIKSATGEIKFTVNRAFDELSRVMDITGNHGQNTHQTYDANGNLDKSTDAKTHQTQHQYDPFDRIKKVIDPKLKETHYTYTPAGLVDTVTDARGNITNYDYDAFGNITRLSSPDTGVSEFQSDEAGNRIYQLDARGVETIYRYDALNRLTHIEYPANPSENVVYSYDSTTAGNYGKGRLTSVMDSSGNTSFFYNYLGQMTQKNYVVRGTPYTTGYAYDLNGLPTQITYPSGRIVTYQYNALKQITGITTQSNASAPIQTLMSNGQYLPFGPLRQWTHGNGIIETHDFDSDYRPTGVTTQGPFAVLDQLFGYDLANNIETIQNPFNSSENQTFGYDELDRLKNASGSYGNINFQYDDVGNRLQKMLTQGSNSSIETYQIEPNSNRLSNVTITVNGVAGTGRSFLYDSAGTLLTGTLKGQISTVNTNDANGIEAINAGAKQIYLHYNHIGQRVSKVVEEFGAVRTEHYHYDETGNLIAVTNSTGDTVNETVFLGSQPLAVSLLTDSPLKISLSAHETVPNPGDTITLSGHAEGGNGQPLEYRYRVKNPSDDWVVVSDWSGNADYSWMVPSILGNYSWELSTRNTGASNVVTTTASISVVAPLAQTTQISSNELAPGASYTLNTLSTGGINNTAYQKRIRLKGPSTNNSFITLQDWVGSENYAATIPTQEGAYTLEVAVRQNPENTSWATVLLPVTVKNEPVTTPSQDSATTSQAGSGGLLSVSQGTGSSTRQFFSIHTDHLKTPRALTDSAGKVVWSWSGQPFGETAANEDPDNDERRVTFNLRFPGQYEDRETGLYYNYFRDYDPLTGRYVQSDPIDVAEHLRRWLSERLPNSDAFKDPALGLNDRASLSFGSPLEVNPYTYVVNNPLRWTDPTGESILDDLGGSDGESSGSQCDDKKKKKEKNCAALRDNIINQTCKSIKNGRLRMACFAAAWATYLSCLSED